MQKPMTGISGAKPAWQVQKGRGEGGGEGRVGEVEKREREEKGRSL